MNEQEFRDAVHGAMVASSPPPVMDGGAALELAQAAQRRRRTTIAATASALAIVAIAAGALIVAAPSRPGLIGSAEPPSSAPPPGRDTNPVWPTGPDGKPQQDRTARNGPRYDQGVRLESELTAALPPGFTVLPDDQAVGQPGNFPLRMHQAQFADRVNGTEIWEYDSYLPVTRDGKSGQVHAGVSTPAPDGQPPANLCDVAKFLYGPAVYAPTGTPEAPLPDQGRQCQPLNVGGKQVVVVTRTRADDVGELDQWAYYLHEDRTVVVIGQARHLRDTQLPSLDAEPFTPEQLAALAADPRFHLN